MQVGVYYFPGYHTDTLNEPVHGTGWTEWELVKRAAPRFEGHFQPKIPLWGYEDESDVAVMEKKITAAADNSINAFIFDWYWYQNEGLFLSAALDKGFLKAQNNSRLKFAIMWANHDWPNIHPSSRANRDQILHPGKVDYATFMNIAEYTVDNYFTHPSYWRVDGGLYYSIYEPDKLIAGLGGIDATADALEEFREMARKKGLGEINLNAVIWGAQILPTEGHLDNANKVLERLGFNSVSTYVWIHNGFPDSFPTYDYEQYARLSLERTKGIDDEFNLPHYPNVTMGWDSSPRTIQSDIYENIGYPFTPILADNSPEKFKNALYKFKNYTESRGGAVLTINAWNEWTEGSYLEPDRRYGYGYLDAIRSVFGV